MSKRNFASYKRKEKFREPKKYFLIICEGAQTEPNYFKSFKVNKSVTSLEVQGLGRNTESLVEEAIRLRKKYQKEKNIQYDECWCVFDRDSFQAEQFNRAIDLAKEAEFKIAYSNESFELWYFLHFHYLDTGITRDQYCEKLDLLLGRKYEKNCLTIYDELKNKQETAIKHAKNLLGKYTPRNPENDKPSTTVHLLVEELNKCL
jgi:hypothetical protein